jgi:hypothetical protein
MAAAFLKFMMGASSGCLWSGVIGIIFCGVSRHTLVASVVCFTLLISHLWTTPPKVSV